MAANQITLFVILACLLTGYIYVAQSRICSTFCATNRCTGWTMYDCNNTCYSGWTYSASLGTCDFAASANMAVLACSDDAYGDITVDPSPGTANCPFTGSPGGSGTPYYGVYAANQAVTATLSIGAYIPYYAFDVYLDLVLVDTNKGGSSRWDNNVPMSAKYLATNQIVTQNINTGGSSSANSVPSGSTIVSTNGYCGDNSKQDNFYRMIFTNFVSNITATSMGVTFSFANGGNAAEWNMREIIFVARICNTYCLSCFNSSITKCYSCDYAQGYMLSGTTCATACLFGYGPTIDPAVCVLCINYCKVCQNINNSCSSCYPSGTNTSYLYYNITLGYSTCVNPCPVALGYFPNNTLHTCDLCNPSCLTCKNATYCYSCAAGYGWFNWFCYMPCNPGFYYSNGTSNCTQCTPNSCQQCVNSSVCTVCYTAGANIGYLLNNTCYNPCPAGYFSYNNSGANECMSCPTNCLTCTGNPTPCLSCANLTYLYNGTCSTTCPASYFAYTLTNQCLNCDQICVSLSIKMWFPTATNTILYIDMTFSQAINFTTFDYQNFQTISIANNDIASFTVSYAVTGANSYRITVQPKGFIFLYNQTTTVTTMSEPATIDTAINTLPFKLINYDMTASVYWFCLKSPSMSELEQTAIDNLGAINNVLETATATPFVAQIKKSGVFALLLSGAHLTSTTLMLNSVPPQNMYEGVRFWGLSTFYDVPAWEQNSNIPNNVFGKQSHSLTSSQRRLERTLFDLTSIDWRFQRLGMTSFFIYDVYIPLLLISAAWIMALVAKLLTKYCEYKFKKWEPTFYNVLHKIHQFSVLYVTTAMMLEWLYFDAGSLARWVSLGMCLGFTCYFVGYHLYIYYDMIRYPEAIIGNDKYEYYVTRYSCFLKNLRFQEYEMRQEWSPAHWFRPYNYHILSYYKKFCIIISLPLFYQSPQWSASILILLQTLQITRFLLTRPYFQTWRTIFRLVLEVTLLIFFSTILALSFIIEQIVLNDPDNVLTYVSIFYNLGWAGFACVWIFNLGFVILMIIDIAQGFRRSNRDLMDEARRVYYYDKITGYEKEYDQVPLGLMNKWVKMGNLNNRNQQQLPDINVRVQYYKLIKHSEYYDVEVLKTVQLFMNIDFNYHKENNTTPGKQIRKKSKLSREISPPLYALVNSLYSQYAKKNTEALVIKTFTRIEQREFQAGDRIPLIPDTMFQKIDLETCSGEKESIKLKQKLQGFPINPHDLEAL